MWLPLLRPVMAAVMSTAFMVTITCTYFLLVVFIITISAAISKCGECFIFNIDIIYVTVIIKIFISSSGK